MEAILTGESIQDFCLRNKLPYNQFQKWNKDICHHRASSSRGIGEAGTETETESGETDAESYQDLKRR